MIVTTTEELPDKKIVKVLGVVFGSCVQTKHVGKDIFAGLRSIVGGEAKGYTEMMEESRRTATDRMIKQAEALGANAIITMRYMTADHEGGRRDSSIRDRCESEVMRNPHDKKKSVLVKGEDKGNGRESK